MRQKAAANAQKRPKSSIPLDVKESSEKVSLSWAKLIARIYEANPLVCQCGKEIKITTLVLHSAEIRRVLSRICWPTGIPEFDPPYDFPDRDICQLLPWTEDGFPPAEAEIQITGKAGPDPPHWDNHSDPPHWED